MRVAVLCNEESLQKYKEALCSTGTGGGGGITQVSVHAITDEQGKPTPHVQLRRLIASRQYDVFANFLPNLYESDQVTGRNSVTSRQVTNILAELRAPCTGVSGEKVHPMKEHIYMLGFYADFNVPKFVVLDTVGNFSSGVKTAEQFFAYPQVSKLPRPFAVLSADGGDALLTITEKEASSTSAETKKKVDELLVLYPRLVALHDVRCSTTTTTEEADKNTKYLKFVVVQDDKAQQGARILDADVVDFFNKLNDKEAETVASRILKGFCGGKGYCTVELLASTAITAPQKADEEKEPDHTIIDVVPNGDISAQVLSSPAVLGLLCATAVANWRAAQPLQSVTFDHDAKGYFVRAARNVSKGEIIYHDEGSCLPVVTKGHVMKYWSEEDKVVFSRFAWPLDSEGHLYCTWQDDPKTWKPINHSCDPNIIFEKDHSLNAIAARDIPEGEDLTLDYATFCDFTMKPFQCFCGTPQCRGMIVPNEEALAKYGAHAWHRRAPPRDRNTI